jgi:hypothetical protein
MADRRCSYPDCNADVRARGLCNKHYLRAWNDGTLDLVAALPGPRERFWSKVAVPQGGDGCWMWTASRCREGYGRFNADDADLPSTLAHRIAYTWLVGPIPEGLTLDHLCRNTSCVNPDHLEPVTAAENSRRAGNWNRGKTHCTHGHEFTTTNTYMAPDGRRACRECRRRSRRQHRLRNVVTVAAFKIPPPDRRRKVDHYSADELHEILVHDAVHSRPTNLLWAVEAYERIGRLRGNGPELAYVAVVDAKEAASGNRLMPV